MPFIRSESQKCGSLKDHYKDEDIIYRQSMENIIDALDDFLETTTVWGLTSLHMINLMNVPEYGEGEAYITLHGVDDLNFYHISYLVPKEKTTIQDLRLKHQTNSIEEAMEFIKYAMKESGGWTNIPELA